MSFPLATFEQHLDATILQRGRAYFQQNQVTLLEEILPGQYEATVEGSLDYTVTLSLHRGKITDYDCDCPYDDTCKHIAAALYALRQQTQIEVGTSGRHNKPTTVGEQIEALLAQVSPEALQQFVRETAIRDHAFRSQLLLAFAHLNARESKDGYAQQVKAVLRASGGRDGFIDYSATRTAAQGVGKLLQIAQQQLDAGEANSALLIGMAVAGEMVKALQYSDDSNGSLGGCIAQAFSLFKEIAESEPTENVRKELLAYCLSAFSEGTFAGWDWHMDLLRIAPTLVATPAEEEQLLSVIDAAASKKANDSYDSMSLQKIKYKLIKQIQGDVAAQAYLEQHLANPDFRKTAIQQAFDRQDYAAAIALATAGIQQDSPRYPGLVNDWKIWLLKIAVIQENKKEIILLSRGLFIDNYSFQTELYELMKKHVAPADWPSFVLELLGEMKRAGYTVIAEIYIREAWWDKLFDMIATSGRLDVIESYEKYFTPDYIPKLVALYVSQLPIAMAQSSSRAQYQQVCHYLQRLIALGGRDRVQELIAAMKAAHPTRRAMIEELNQVL